MKATAIILAGVYVVVGTLLTAYDWREVQPRLPGIRAAMETFPSEERNVPANVAAFIWKLDETQKAHIASQVARVLLGEAPPMRAGAWHAHSFMWALLLPVHFDKQTRTALYCHNIVYENGRGLSGAAAYYFHKSPHELSTEEIAGILAIDGSPSINSPTRHQDRYAQASKRLLDAYATP